MNTRMENLNPEKNDLIKTIETFFPKNEYDIKPVT